MGLQQSGPTRWSVKLGDQKRSSRRDNEIRHRTLEHLGVGSNALTGGKEGNKKDGEGCEKEENPVGNKSTGTLMGSEEVLKNNFNTKKGLRM